jgi:signal transduction histidine kinase
MSLRLFNLRYLTVSRRMTIDHWLNRLFNQAPIAIALLEGPDYRIKLANINMYRLWKLPEDHESVIGRPVFEAFPSITGMGLEELLADVRRTGQPTRGVEAPYTSPDNQIAYVDFVYAPVYDEKETMDIVVMATEVTQQVLARRQLKENEERYRRMAEELAARNEELAISNRNLEEANSLLIRSNESLQRFAYVASHDLQEPLRKIQSFGDMLESQYAGQLGEGMDFLQRMRLAAGRMSMLIKDLLNFSRVAAQRNSNEPVGLGEVVTQVLDVLELAIAEAGARIQVDALPTVNGDSTQLEQLFQNLIGNALKFRRAGVACHIRISSQPIAYNELPPSIIPLRRTPCYERITIADNGIGFDEKYLDRIFQVFQRLHSRPQYPGTGIGLAICEKVVTNHGGVLTASSEPGQGSTFIIYLPALEPSAPLVPAGIG